MARLAVRSSLTWIWLSLNCRLYSFRRVRARNTSSRTASLRKRTIIARLRGRPCSSFFRPSRLLRSRWSAPMWVNPSFCWIVPITTASVFSPSSSGMPWKRRFGRLEYCSRLSASASNVATFFTKPSICSSLAARPVFSDWTSLSRCAICRRVAAHTVFMSIGAITSIISRTVFSCSFFLPLFGVSLRALRYNLNLSNSVAKHDSTTLLISSVDIVISEAERVVSAQRGSYMGVA